MLENTMVDNCCEYFATLNTYTKIVREVPFLSRCIDVVLITTSGITITIEFKINDWKHAIEQAKTHMLGTDKAYVCLPRKTPSDEMISMLKDAQIGLLFYSPECKNKIQEYLPAPESSRKVQIFHSNLLKTIECIDTTIDCG
jgi:hypothetical protein